MNDIITVSQLNYYVKSLMDGDEALQNVFVSGEVSNFTNHYRSGHFYLSLKDENSCIKAMMFSNAAQRIRFEPEDGMKVLVRGRVSIYEATGQYQLYIYDMQPDGIGALNLAFEQLKKKLSSEGLFEKERKLPLPMYPKRIGIITSPTGAAIRDIKSVLSRRFPIAQLVLCPVLVQGDEAPKQITSAIDRFNSLTDMIDVIILGRGGGSIEDLWAFNDERVARAISNCSIPIISAVGHETDFTICDFVADMRAPTPSAAAEIVAPDIQDILIDLNKKVYDINTSMNKKITTLKSNLDYFTRNNKLLSPINMINSYSIKLDLLSSKLYNAFNDNVSTHKHKFAEVVSKLDVLSPLNILSRGYSVTYKSDGKALKSVRGVKQGQNVTTKFKDGRMVCKVLDVIRSETDEKESVL